MSLIYWRHHHVFDILKTSPCPGYIEESLKKKWYNCAATVVHKQFKIINVPVDENIYTSARTDLHLAITKSLSKQYYSKLKQITEAEVGTFA